MAIYKITQQWPPGIVSVTNKCLWHRMQLTKPLHMCICLKMMPAFRSSLVKDLIKVKQVGAALLAPAEVGAAVAAPAAGAAV